MISAPSFTAPLIRRTPRTPIEVRCGCGFPQAPHFAALQGAEGAEFRFIPSAPREMSDES